MKATKHIVLSLAVCAFATTWAQHPAVDKVVARIVACDAALRSTEAEQRAVLADMSAEATLANPEIEFERKWAATPDAADKWGLGISQSFDWPGYYRAKRRARNMSAGAFALLRESDTLTAVHKARLAVIDYMQAAERLKIVQTVRANIDSIARLSAASLRAGSITVLDYRKLRLASATMASQAKDAEAQLASARQSITSLASGQFVDLAGLPGSLADIMQPLATLDTYLESARLSDPALAAWSMRRESLAADAAAARMQSMFPGFSVGYTHDYEERTHFNGFSIGITLPIYGRKARAKAAEARAEALSADAFNYEQQLRADITSAYARANAALLSAQAYSMALDAVPGNTDYLTLLQRSLAAGQITVLTYLQETGYYTERSLEMLDYRYRYVAETATLNRFVAPSM